MPGRLYGTEGFQPRKIILQIVAMQTVFYVAYVSALTAFHLFFGTSIDLRYVLSYKVTTIETSYGWASIMSMFIAAIISAYAMAYIVERFKKCADFTFTIYFWHVVFSSFYGGFPVTWEWWIIHIVAMLLTGLLAEQFCMRREMEDIDVNQIVSRKSSEYNDEMKGGMGGIHERENGGSNTAAAATLSRSLENRTEKQSNGIHGQGETGGDLERQPLLQGDSRNHSHIDRDLAPGTKQKVISEANQSYAAAASARTRRSIPVEEAEVSPNGPSPSKEPRRPGSSGEGNDQSMFTRLKMRWPGFSQALGMSPPEGRRSPG